ncbi:hypothetical protein KIH39_00150 [Telmatocola sphagniphila]|uniref:Uncharacterized protein n=1 Tax=Telmatocola sphagniphila TaxID=1123043 RepID=A0A8E6EYH2_9BACT|nr:hypothetical protein [Telmatocola sphagniphila]QVL32366.1 hypothetical protein KIH39_00150 [Telmatocola sphagniphila]
MNLAEYLNPERFPLTTRAQYTPESQLKMDYFNWKGGQKHLEEGGTLDEQGQAIQRELEEKMKYHAACVQELEDQKKPRSPFYLSPEEAARVEKGHREMMEMLERKYGKGYRDG